MCAGKLRGVRLWVLAIGLAALCGTSVFAQTVHLINVADTADAKVGQSCAEDAGNFAQIMFIGLPEGMLAETRLTDDQVSADQILKQIAEVRVHPNDTLVFFWSGHGGYDTTKNEHFLHMPQGGMLFRSTLLGALRKKNARLTVLLTDSCANFVDTSANLIEVAPSSPDPQRGVAPLFDALFLRPRGVVDIQAAAPGEYAVALRGGGLFGMLLACSSLYESPPENSSRPVHEYMVGYLWANMDRRVSWNQMVKQIQEVAPRLFAAAHPDGIEHPDGHKQTTQTITAFQLPDESVPEGSATADPRGSRFGVPAVAHGTDGVRITAVWDNYPGTQVIEVATGRKLVLEPGDIILEVNGRPLRSLQDYIDSVRSSPRIMEFVIRNVRNGERVPMRVRLRY